MTLYKRYRELPVADDLTVTASDLPVVYPDMSVPAGVTVTVETGGTLIDAAVPLTVTYRPVNGGFIS